MELTEKVRMYFGMRSILVADEHNKDFHDPNFAFITHSHIDGHYVAYFTEEIVPYQAFISRQSANNVVNQRAHAEICVGSVTIRKTDYLRLKNLVDRIQPKTDDDLKQAEKKVRKLVEEIIKENNLSVPGSNHALLWSTYEQICNKMGRTIYFP